MAAAKVSKSMLSLDTCIMTTTSRCPLKDSDVRQMHIVDAWNYGDVEGKLTISTAAIRMMINATRAAS